MSEETYHSVPRSKIPWYPTIDYEKCVSCGKCVDYCTLGAYEFEENQRKKRPVVKNPNNCVVFCTGCEEQCSAGAIKFPSKKETREIIKKLQKAKAYQAFKHTVSVILLSFSLISPKTKKGWGKTFKNGDEKWRIEKNIKEQTYYVMRQDP